MGSTVVLIVGMLAALFTPAAAALGDAWVEEAPLPTARAHAVMEADEAGLVYVCGGTSIDFHGAPLDSTFSYDAMTGEAQWLAPMPIGVRGAASALGNDGNLYVFSGMNDTLATRIPDTQIYKPEADAWTAGADIPVPVWGAAAECGDDGLFYVMGGSDNTGTGRDLLQIYDPVSDSWSNGPSMPSVSYTGSTTVWYDEYIVYMGGQDGLGAIQDDVYVYDIAYGTWTTSDPLPTPCYGAAACTGADGWIYYVGGYDGIEVKYGGFVLNPPMGDYIDLPEMADPRLYAGAATTPDGRVVVLGGGYFVNMLDSVESLDVADISVALSSDSVVQGGSVELLLSADFAFVSSEHQEVVFCLVGPDDTVYAYEELSFDLWAPLSIEVSVPETCDAGEYRVVVMYYGYCAEGWLWWTPIVVDLELALTVTEGYTLEEQLSMLEANVTALADALEAATDAQDLEIAALQDALAALQADIDALTAELSSANSDISGLSEDLAALQTQLTELETTLADLEDQTDGVQTSLGDKADSVLLYAVIALLVVVIVLLLVLMVAGRKAPPPPAP